MTVKTINQKKAVELLKSGQTVSGYQIQFDDEKIEALDAFLLRKNGVALPDDLVFYDDTSIDFEDDADVSAEDFTDEKLIRVLRAEIVVDKEIADWMSQGNININQLLSNLIKDFYKNAKAASLLASGDRKPRTMH